MVEKMFCFSSWLNLEPFVVLTIVHGQNITSSLDLAWIPGITKTELEPYKNIPNFNPKIENVQNLKPFI